MLYIIIILVLAYVVGSLPTGYWVARLQGVADIRNHGSGNIGATNVARVLGFKYFFLIFALDAGKAYAYLWVINNVMRLQESTLMAIALVLLLGNMYSIFLSGSGGKGVATFTGAVCATMPYVGFIFVGLWGVGVAVMRTVGIVSVLSVAITPFVAFVMGYDLFSCLVLVVMASFVIGRHIENIRQFISR